MWGLATAVWAHDIKAAEVLQRLSSNPKTTIRELATVAADMGMELHIRLSENPTKTGALAV